MKKETFILLIFAGLLLFLSNEAFSGSKTRIEEVVATGGEVTEKKAIKSASQKAIQKEAGISVGGGTLCTDIPRFALCTSAPCQNEGT